MAFAGFAIFSLLKAGENSRVITYKQEIEKLFKELFPLCNEYVDLYDHYGKQTNKLKLYVRIKKETILTIGTIIKNYKRAYVTYCELIDKQDNNTMFKLGSKIIEKTKMDINIVKDMIDELKSECEILVI